MRFTSFRVATGLLLAGCVAFIATAYGEHRSLAELVARNSERHHALRTQLLVQRVGSLLIDLETGQRGFIITGQVAFLAPYERARAELDSTYSSLKQHLSRAGAPPPLSQLDEFIARRVKQAEQNVARRWQEGDAVLRDLSAYVAGKQLMDDIRAELTILGQQQERLIEAAEQRSQAVQQRTALLSAVLPLVGALLIVGAVAALLHERRRRDQAEQALRDANAKLESVVARRTGALRTALTRIQSFAAELDRGIEAERTRLAREVHDQIGQVGTASKMLVLALKRKLAPAKEEMLDELQTLADESIARARQIAAALRPPLLDDFGLAAAVGHYVKSLERQGGLQTRLDMQDDGQLSPEQRTQLFRILQEAATNVLRHAKASELHISGLADAGGYRLEIVDNGVGPGDVRADASGLRNMRERAALAGGEFQFGPGPAGGTRVGICLPLAGDAAAPAQEEAA